MRRAAIVGAVTSGALVLGGPLLASTYEIDLAADINSLASDGVAYWDGYNQGSACSSGVGYTPVYDGEFLGVSDAFDSAFMISIGSNSFADPNDLATLSAGTLDTGTPGTLGGLKVSAVSRSFMGTPALQYLVKLHNPTSSAIKKQVKVSTDLGSDTSTVVRATSSGDAVQTAADRWVVSTEGATEPFGDPVVTQAFRGKGAAAKFTLVTPLTDGSECMVARFGVKVPAKADRYLLLYAEMHENVDAGKRAAVRDAKRYDSQKTMSALLKGIPTKLYPQILNWDLNR